MLETGKVSFFITEQNRITEVLGENLYNELLGIKDKIKLGRTLFGYYDRCFIANEILARHNFFIKFSERRGKFRFFIKSKLLVKMR